MKIAITDIVIGDRQRKDLGNIDDLAASMGSAVGQIQAITVDKLPDGKYLLVAGKRRLAAAERLGWQHIEATLREYPNEEVRQEAEFEEDIRRKDRTWQEKCLALSKLFHLKSLQSMRDGYNWTCEKMASLVGFSETRVTYMLDIAKHLKSEPATSAIWQAPGLEAAIKCVFQIKEREALAELERRRKGQPQKQLPTYQLQQVSEAQEKINTLPPAAPAPITLQQRAEFFNKAFPQLLPLTVNFTDGKPFLYGWWFVGGGNVSDFYGSYQIEYLKRIETLFPDKTKVVHLFSGSLPPSEKYLRVGIDPTGQYKADLEIDAHQLSSHLPFHPDLIYADPPYSIEDSEHYKCGEVNRPKVVSECALILQPGGFLVWMDQALPVFSNDEIRLVGGIAYIRSTGNRFRVVCLFQKPMTL